MMRLAVLKNSFALRYGLDYSKIVNESQDIFS
jgi:hypothetical protein